MTKYKFSFENEKEKVEVTLTPKDEDQYIRDFHRYAKLMAHLVGYTDSTIDKYFGETEYED